jgi:hypothetical protein
MNISSMAFTVGVVLGVLYAVLGFVAFFHVEAEKRKKQSVRLLSITLWWPFYDIYDESVRKLCLFGRFLMPIAVAAYIVSAIYK